MKTLMVALAAAAAIGSIALVPTEASAQRGPGGFHGGGFRGGPGFAGPGFAGGFRGGPGGPGGPAFAGGFRPGTGPWIGPRPWGGWGGPYRGWDDWGWGAAALGYGVATAAYPACPVVWYPGYGYVRSCNGDYGYPAAATRVVHVAAQYSTRVVYAQPRRAVARRAAYRSQRVRTIRRVYY